MTPQQSARVTRSIAAAVLVVVGYVAFDWTRWWVFDGRIHAVLVHLPRKPAADDLLAVRPRILEEARDLWLRPSSIDLEIHLEQHTSNGYAAKEDQLECYWFLVVTARQGSRTASWEQRIDNKVAETDTETLEKGFVAVKRKGFAPGG